MRKYLVVVCGLLTAATLAMGQKPKSKNEQDAVIAVMKASTPDEKIAAAENLLTKYKDTEFKSFALLQAAQGAQLKGDQVAAITYGSRAIEADANNFQALLLVSGLLAQSTREFDLDKDEKLGRSTKMANDAIAAVNAAAKPNPALTDDQWAGIKKDMISQAHDTLGTIAMVLKKYDTAIAEFKSSIEVAATPEPATSVRLAAAYTNVGKFDDSSALLDKVTADPAVSAPIKRAAQAEKMRVEKAKSVQK
jgi:tetratricopeptide (TPR) repeat protein